MAHSESNPVNPTPPPKLPLSAAQFDEIERIDSLLSSVQSRYSRASDLAELGVFSSMFAHEINNLMTQVGGRAQLALMNMDQPQMVLRALELACSVSTQIAQLSEIFLESAQSNSLHADEYSVCDVHERAIEFIADDDILAYGLTLDVGDTDHTISIPPLLLQQVLLNLYLNAIRSIEESSDPSDHQITTRIERVEIENERDTECSTGNTSRIQITVEDTGIGMSADQVEHLFDPWDQHETSFCSPDPQNGSATETAIGREHGRGHGLGLAVCKRLLNQANGTIHVHSVPGTGTKMIITLPSASCVDKRQAA